MHLERRKVERMSLKLDSPSAVYKGRGRDRRGLIGELIRIREQTAFIERGIRSIVLSSKSARPIILKERPTARGTHPAL